MENLNLLDYSISIDDEEFLYKTLHAINKIEHERDAIKESLNKINKKLAIESKVAFKTIADRLR